MNSIFYNIDSLGDVSEISGCHKIIPILSFLILIFTLLYSSSLQCTLIWNKVSTILLKNEEMLLINFSDRFCYQWHNNIIRKAMNYLIKDTTNLRSMWFSFSCYFPFNFVLVTWHIYVCNVHFNTVCENSCKLHL